MQSKEAIRNQILSYTHQIWGTKRVERLDMLVQMMVNTLTNELYLVQNKLSDVDTTLLERIARKMTPEKCASIRPAHTVLQMSPKQSLITLKQNNEFTLEWAGIGNSGQETTTVSFYPVADFRLYNAKISNLFYHKQLYSFDNNKKKLEITTDIRLRNTYLWIGLDIDSQEKNLNGLSFYLNFPQLSEIHELYEMLPYTKCHINGKEVRLKQGLSFDKKSVSETDTDVFRYYNDHYLTIDEDVDTGSWKTENLPEILSGIIDPEEAKSLPPKHWLCLEFSPYFTADMLQDMNIVVNAFPVVNRKWMQASISKNNLLRTTTLSSDVGEKLLSIESVTDDKGRNYVSDISIGNSDVGTYHIETTNNVFIEELGLADYVEQLLDLVDDERAVFAGVDKDRITQVLSMLTDSDDKDAQKTEDNNRNRHEEVSRLSVNPFDGTNSVDLSYWVTWGEWINNLPAGKSFALNRNKIAELEGITATSLCEIHGAKDFSDIQDVMSINSYVLTSKDRIVTEHSIISFCESELGRAVEKVEVELGGKKSPKPKEGLVKVLNVNLTPSKGSSELLYQKGVLKNLKMRLENRSPEEYRYEIRVVE